MNKTGIEYLTHTWNPIAMRCTPVSEGCKRCWHIARAKMLAKNPQISGYVQKAYAGTEPPRLIKPRLSDPLKVKKPSMIGVQFMGDLFHEDVPFEFIINIFGTMLKAKQHTYLLLTKRPQRAKEFMEVFLNICSELAYDKFPNSEAAQIVPIEFTKTAFAQNSIMVQTMSHIWLGITAENQKLYDERWTIVSKIPAAIRFVSLEPALEHINIDIFAPWPDWVIWGPETGIGKRPFSAWWAESVYDQCQEKNIPFFDKRKNFIAREFPK